MSEAAQNVTESNVEYLNANKLAAAGRLGLVAEGVLLGEETSPKYGTRQFRIQLDDDKQIVISGKVIADEIEKQGLKIGDTLAITFNGMRNKKTGTGSYGAFVVSRVESES